MPNDQEDPYGKYQLVKGTTAEEVQADYDKWAPEDKPKTKKKLTRKRVKSEADLAEFNRPLTREERKAGDKSKDGAMLTSEERESILTRRLEEEMK